MIIDASAVLAILLAEADAERYAEAIHAADACRMSAANFLEAAIIIDNRVGTTAGRQLDNLLGRANIGIEPVTAAQARLARQAYLEFGKGNHPAALNFGDCFAYALAKAAGEPLLFKGEDFSRTDVHPVL